MWAQACGTTVYVLILTGKTPVIGKSPMEMWNGHVIKKLDHLRVFGMECHVYIPKQFWKKFYNKSVFGRMIKTGTRFTWHISTTLCIRVST